MEADKSVIAAGDRQDAVLPHWWSFPAPCTTPTVDQLTLRAQFDSLLQLSGADLSSMRRATDRVGHTLNQIIHRSLAINGVDRDALQLSDLHELVIELTPVFHELLADLGLHGADCTSLRIALHDGLPGARQSMIVSEIVDHYSLRWQWADAEAFADQSRSVAAARIMQRPSRSQLVLEHLIRQHLHQPSADTLQDIGIRLKSVLLRGRCQPSEVPPGAHWFDLCYVPEAVRYKNEHALRQRRLLTDVLQSRLVRDR